MDALGKLAGLAAKTDMTTQEKLQESTENYKQALPDFARIHIDNATGTSITFAPAAENGKSTIGLSFSDRSYYKEMKSTLRPVMSDVFMGRVGIPAPIVTLGVPVLSQNRFNGYVIGVLNLSYIKNLLKQSNQCGTMDTTLVDSNGFVIVSTRNNLETMKVYDRKQNGEIRQLGGGVYQWLPPVEKNVAEAVRWQKSFYVRETPLGNNLPWTLVFEVPVVPYQNEMQRNNIERLGSMLAVTLLALLFANFISRSLVGPLASLAQVTTDLPGKIFDRQSIDWPKSSVAEMESLVDNFKSMSATLQQNFKALWEEKEHAKDLLTQMIYQAHHDPLTDLPNRTLFNDRLILTLAEARREKQKLAVLFIDLDQFKLVNDMLGHAMGDLLLQKVAESLSGCLQAQDTIARMGGDEFTVLLPRITREEDAAEVARKILQTFQKPWVIDCHEFHITASIGIAIFPNDGGDAETIMKHADTAMYRAKEEGRNNYRFFTSTMNAVILERMALEQDLRHALERKEFVVYYQPLVNTANGQITGMEALVRWQHPDQGLIYPDRFIPSAEETGLIVPIGEWVLRTACAQNKAWQEAGLPPVRVTVNISARQFRQHNLVQMVARVLKETVLEPHWLELEVTESAAMEDVEFTISTLRELREMGIRLAIDDFGTGYSSLNYLKRFPIHTLKIDRFFVRDITTNSEDAAIVTTIIVLGQNLNLRVIAEGVETEEQMIFFKQRRCEEMQGYLFSKPVPAGEFEIILRRSLI